MIKVIMTFLVRSLVSLFLITSQLVVDVLVVQAEVPNNGHCNILTFVPFTYRGTELPYYIGKRRNNLGFSHMASAMLAMEHFNNNKGGDSSSSVVVPELASDPRFSKCPFRFNTNTSLVFDTEIFSQAAARQMQQYILLNNNNNHNNIPCAVSGAFFDQPARELSVLSSTLEIPMVAYRVLDPTLSHDELYPYTVQTNGDSVGFATPLLNFLKLRGRTNHIAFLVSGASQYQIMAESFQRGLQSEGMQTIVINYLPGRFTTTTTTTPSSSSSATTTPAGGNDASVLQSSIIQTEPTGEKDYNLDGGATGSVTFHNFFDIYNAMGALKSTGFRTIVVLANEKDVLADLPVLAEVAESLGMNTGDHFWIFVTGLPTSGLQSIQDNDLVVKFLRGAAVLDYADAFAVDKDDDAFLKSWRAQNATFVDLLREKNPIPEGMPGHYNPSDDYFQTVDPEPGASFLYDSVMSIGMGACLQIAASNNNNSSLDGQSHLEGIKRSEFSGASGKIRYTGGAILGATGVRDFRTGLYTAYNIFPPGSDEVVVLTEVLDMENSSTTLPRNDDSSTSSSSSSWISLEEFVFASGETVGPPLRDMPEMNFLSPGIRIGGLTMMGLVIFVALASIVWVFVEREHQVMKAAQPGMLVILMIGVIIESCTILTLSFDESYGLTQQQLSRLCVAGPWLFIVGHGLLYAALFAKLWRVHKVLQFSRVRITLRQAIWPVRVFLLASVVLLAGWTATVDFVWVREVVNDVTGESFGRCKSDGEKVSAWILCEVFCIAAPVILSLLWAWKTKDVDPSFSESSWIFILIFVQLQTAAVGAPLFIILIDLSTNGRYIGVVLILFMHTFSAVLLIMLPKMLSYYEVSYRSGNVGGRGTRAGTRISGLTDKFPPADTAIDSRMEFGEDYSAPA